MILVLIAETTISICPKFFDFRHIMCRQNFAFYDGERVDVGKFQLAIEAGVCLWHSDFFPLRLIDMICYIIKANIHL